MKLMGIAGCFRGQKGFSLLEVLVAVGIMGFIGVGVIMALDTNSRASRALDEKVEAVNLATAYVEEIRTMDYENFGNYYGVGSNIALPPQYTVDIDVECSYNGTDYGVCTGSANETLQKIVIRVSHGGRPVFSMCTYKADF